MSGRGSTAVTPVRTGPVPTASVPSPRTMVAWPTSTPATSVMAFSGPVGYDPIVMPRSRALTRAVWAAVGMRPPVQRTAAARAVAMAGDGVNRRMQRMGASYPGHRPS